MTASANTNATANSPNNPLPPPPALSNETLRERILTGGGTGNARGSLARVAARYASFLHSLSSTDDADANNATAAAAAALQTELLLHDLEIRKLILSSKASDGNSARYTSTLASMQKTLTSTQEDIDKLTTTLTTERRVKSHREEYNALAKMVNDKAPPIRVTKNELQKVQEEIESVQREVKEAKWELNVRERQMRVFMACLGDLKGTLREEELKKKVEGEIDNKKRSNMDDDIDVKEGGKKRKRTSDDSEDNNDIGAL